MDIYTDIEKTKAEFEKLEPGSGEQLEKYLAAARKSYPLAMDNFVFKDYDSIWQTLTLKNLASALKLNVFSTLYTYVSRFIKNEDLKKVLLYTTVFL